MMEDDFVSFSQKSFKIFRNSTKKKIRKRRRRKRRRRKRFYEGQVTI